MAAWQAPRTAGMARAALYAGRIGGSGDTCAVILPATREILVSVAAGGADVARPECHYVRPARTWLFR